MDKSILLLQLLGILTESKVFHWQTKMYSKHRAFGSFYITLQGLTDTFIETYQGKYGRIILTEENDSLGLDNLSKTNLSEWLKILRTFFGSDIRSYFSEEDRDLHNICDEMLGEVNKLAYLLTLE